MAMKFAHVMCGSKEARVGGSISPYTFLDRKSSHRSLGRVVGPTLQYKTLTELSEAVDRGMVVIECHVSFRPSPVGFGEEVQSNEALTLVYSSRLDSLNNINLSVVCALACQNLKTIQVSMTTLD